MHNITYPEITSRVSDFPKTTFRVLFRILSLFPIFFLGWSHPLAFLSIPLSNRLSEYIFHHLICLLHSAYDNRRPVVHRLRTGLVLYHHYHYHVLLSIYLFILDWHSVLFIHLVGARTGLWLVGRWRCYLLTLLLYFLPSIWLVSSFHGGCFIHSFTFVYNIYRILSFLWLSIFLFPFYFSYFPFL